MCGRILQILQALLVNESSRQSILRRKKMAAFYHTISVVFMPLYFFFRSSQAILFDIKSVLVLKGWKMAEGKRKESNEVSYM